MNWGLSNKAKDRLPKLRVPAHTASPSNLPYTDTKVLEAWIADLPLANSAKTVRQLFEVLVECNRCNIPHQTRFKMAEHFRHPIHNVRHGLEKRHILDSAAPLNLRNRNIAILNREVHSELAIAYKIIVKDALHNEQKAEKKILTTAIHRAIKHLSDLLVLSTMVYNPSPENAWQEIHSLYNLACSRGLEKSRVSEPCDEPATKSTIHNLYLQTLMYALASPYCLRQRECQLILRKLPEWVSLVDLNTPGVNGSNQGNFVVRLASDEPPSHIKLQKKKLSNRCRLLDTEHLIGYLEKLLQETTAKQAKVNIYHPMAEQLPIPLLQYLIKTWNADPKRNKHRTSMGFELQLAIGLASTHALLKEGAKAKSATEVSADDLDEEEFHWFETQIATHYAASPPPTEKPAETNKDKPEKNTKAVASRTVVNQTIKEQAAPWTSQNNESTHITTYSCRTLNESSGGYCMDWQGQEAPEVKVGELIGIQSTIDSNQFGIGAIRWIKHTGDEKLQLGMEIVAPDAVAVELCEIDDDGQHFNCRNCLLLPKIKAKGTGSSVIIPPLSFQSGDALLIRDDDDERRIELAQLIESTAAYARYRFTHNGSEGLEKEQDSENQEEQETEKVDFEAIWSML